MRNSFFYVKSMAFKARPSVVSVFDEELMSDFLRNVRIVGKDLKSGDSDEKQDQVVEKKLITKNGNFSSNL